MRTLFLFFIVIVFTLPGFSQENQAYYRVSFIDKVGTQYSIDHPEEFLSPESIARRVRFNISIDESDLPISTTYLNNLEDAGFHLVHQSKWNNSATVAINDGNAVDRLLAFSFVEVAELVKPLLLIKSSVNKFETIAPRVISDSSLENEYGNSWEQIHQLKGELLHDKGYRGDGIHIAVLDAGFDGVDTISAFKILREENRILGTRDFVNPGGNVFRENEHGTNVLSTMASNLPGYYIGTAPAASYWLIRSEDNDSEYPIEEDNWVAALEFADSLGVDLVSSSLGYYEFDESSMNHSFADLDGKSSLITSAANMAVQKGILVVNSAGNEGNKTWKKIILPGDGEKVLTVGAVNQLGNRASFSSMGPNAAGNIKPNVVACGEATWIVRKDGTMTTANGTSFSTPVISGIMACLQQAFPLKKPEELKEIIELSGHQSATPDTLIGYGIPDVEQIIDTGRMDYENELISLFPNPFQNRINIHVLKPVNKISLFDINGRCMVEKTNLNRYSFISGLDGIPKGFYFLEIKMDDKTIRKKLLKN